MTVRSQRNKAAIKGGWMATAAILAAVVASTAVAQTSRLSLSERVARLEQQADGGNSGGSVDLLNRITQLQGEVQSLRNQVEQQNHEIELLKQQLRDQYVALDTRLNRLEGGATAAPSTGSASTIQELPPDPRVPNASSQLQMEEPEVAQPPQEASTAMPLTDSTPASTDTVAAPQADEQSVYDAAFESLKNGQYAESARRFQAFLHDYPDGQLAPNAQYWLGESYYVTQNYQVALDAFRDLLRRFPNSAKAPDALLKVGYCHYELRQWQDAESVLSQVIEQYPDTTVARLAQGRLRALRLENRQ